MRRFFILNLERLLNLLTLLAGLALLAWAVRAAWAAQTDPQELLRIAAALLGGLVAIVALAGGAYVMLSIHDDIRRIAAHLGRPEASGLRAGRETAVPRPAQGAKASPTPATPAPAVPAAERPEESRPYVAGRTPITTPPLMAQAARPLPEPPAPDTTKPARRPRLVAERRPLR